MQRHCSRWSDDDVARLRSLVEAGYSAAEVAVALERTIDAVQGRGSILGISWKRAQFSPELVRKRFMRTVKTGDDCHLWTGIIYRNGYGQFTLRNRQRLAHRFAWELEYGPIPGGLFVCHRCDTPACVRPDHLYLGTHTDNMRDMHAKGRQARPGRLSDAMIITIKEAPGSQHAVAKRFGLSQGQVSLIRSGKSRRDAWNRMLAAATTGA